MRHIIAFFLFLMPAVLPLSAQESAQQKIPQNRAEITLSFAPLVKKLLLLLLIFTQNASLKRQCLPLLQIRFSGIFFEDLSQRAQRCKILLDQGSF